MNRLAEAAPKVASWVLSHAADVSLGLGTGLVMGAIMLLCLFYLHLSGDRLVARVRMALPLPEGETEALLEVFRRTSLAILKGNFVVALVQGALTGLLFMVVGLPSPVLFGVVAGLCSLVPSVGSALVWVPGAIALAAMGSWGAAVVVVLVGALVISMVDNVLRPVLVGRDTGMHDLLVLLTTLGGISFFGPLGILFGPLVGAAFLALLERHEKRLLEARRVSGAPGVEGS
jgi:predicted PurR-regulated permease PerM